MNTINKIVKKLYYDPPSIQSMSNIIYIYKHQFRKKREEHNERTNNIASKAETQTTTTTTPKKQKGGKSTRVDNV
jgi:hypothetical protein